MKWAYYNDNDPFAADWLELLIMNDLIAPGHVDRRSIVDVRADDLREFGQVHFFAGIGGWSYAFRLAGVPDEKPWWSASCPCQPFSQAGKGKGEKDERHLWPEFYRILREADEQEHGPSICFGEQVASPLGREWLAGIRSDLERTGRIVGAANLPSAGVRAPHIRQRLYWLANSTSPRCIGAQQNAEGETRHETRLLLSCECGTVDRLAYADGRFAGNGRIQSGREYGQFTEDCGVGGLGFSNSTRLQSRGQTPEAARHGHSVVAAGDIRAGGGLADAECITGDPRGATDEPRESTGTAQARARAESGRCGVLGRMDNPDDARLQRRRFDVGEHADQQSPWASSVFMPCTDGKFRRIPATEAGEPEPALFPLAHGVPNRVGALRGSGNAINPWVAKEFILASIEAIDALRTP